MSDLPKILVIDDDPNLTKTLSDILELKGFAPFIASMGGQAITVIGKEDIAVALIDLKLADTDGLKILSEIRVKSPETQCILLTGHASQDSAISAINLGAFSYLKKPYDIDQLLVTIQRAVEKRTTERKLREREAAVSSIFRAAPIGIGLLLNRVILHVNEQICNITGYSPQELIGNEARILYPSDEAHEKVGIEKYRQIAESGIGSIETQWVRKDGELRDIFLSSTWLDPSRPGAETTFIAQDITDRKQVEQALVQSEKQYRTLFTSMAEGVVYHDSGGTITSANPAALQILGRPLDQLVGRHPIDLELQAIQEDGTPFQINNHPIVASIKTGQPILNTILGFFNPIDNAIRWININTIPQFQPGESKPSQYFSTFSDITDRKRAEQYLSESQRRLSTLMSNLPGMVYRCRADDLWTMEFVSEGSCALTGYSPEEFVNGAIISYADLIHPQDRAFVRDVIFESIANNQPFHLTYRIITKEGEEKFVWEQGRYIDQSNDVSLLEGLIMDVSKQRRYEDQLQESYDNLEEAEQIAHLGQYKYDPLTNRSIWSKELFRLFGVSPETDNDNIHLTFREHIFSEDLSVVDAAYGDAVYQGKPIDLIFRIIREDGQIRYVHNITKTIPNPDAETYQLIGTMQDITLQKQTELALKEAQEFYEVLFDQSPDAIFILDLDGGHVEVNHRACQMLGYSKDELRQSSFQQLTDSPSEKSGIFQSLVKGEHIAPFERSLRKKNGETVPVEFHLNLILDEQGAPYRVQAIAHELTDRKRAEQEIQRYINELVAIYENGLAINRLYNVEDIAQKIIDTFAHHLSWHHVIIRLRRGVSDDLELVALNQAGLDPADKEQAAQVYKSRISKVGQGLSGWVVETGEAIRTGNVHEFPQYVDSYPGMQSGLYMPLTIGDRVIGVISVESDLPDAFKEADERLLATVAAQAAVALENARLFAEVQQRADVLAAIHQTTQDLTNITDLKQLMDAITHRVAQQMGVSGVSIHHYDPKTDEAEIVASTHPLVPVHTRMGRNDGLAGIVIQTRQTEIIDNYQDWPGRFEQFKDLPISSIMITPMVYRNALVGLLTAYNFSDDPSSASSRRFTPEDGVLLSLFASTAANAVVIARLFDDIRGKADHLSILYNISRTLSQIYNPIEIGRTIIPELQSLMGWQHGGLWLTDNYQAPKLITHATPDTGPSSFNIFLPLQPGEGIVGWVIAHGEVVRCGDVNTDERYVRMDPATRSEICVPLKAGSQTIGCINFESEVLNFFTEEDEHLLITIASEISSAIERAQLYEQMQHRLSELEALVHIGRALTTTQDVDIILQNILATAKWAIPATEKSTILLYEKEELRIRASQGYDLADLGSLNFLNETGYATRAFREQRGILVEDAPREYQLPFTGTFNEVNAVKSGIAAPLIVKDKTIGVLCLDNISQTSAFTQNDLNLLSAFASSAALYIEGARLFSETRRQAEELGAIVQIAAAMRNVSKQSEMLPIILDQMSEIMSLEGAAIILRDASTGRNYIELGRGSCLHKERSPLPPEAGMISQVISTGEPFITNDLKSTSTASLPCFPTDSDAAVCFPMIAEGDVIGAIWSYRKLEFSESDFHTMSAIADMAASAIRRTGLYERTVEHAEQMVQINNAGRKLSETLNLAEVYTRLTEALYQLFPDIRSVFISHYDSDNQQIRCVYAREDGEPIEASSLPTVALDLSGKDYQSRAILSGEPLTIQNLDSELDTSIGADVGTLNKQAASAIFVPLVINKNVIGLIQLQSLSSARFDQDDLDLLGLVANSAAAAIQNARLYLEVQERLRERERAEKALKAIQADLENRVEARTAELSRANAELARAMRGRDEFLANMSHELRTPLNAILGISESLEEKVIGPLNEKQEKYIHTINESGRHLLALINDILDLSKIEAGRMTLDLQYNSLDLIVQSALRIVKELAQKKNLSITYTTDNSVETFLVDGRRIKQALVNLLSNAVKFTPQGGKIGLEITGNAQAGQMTLAVWDTGIGIKPENISRLFQPFVQFDAGLNREHAGTGLGLAMVAQIVKMHGGRVEVESSAGVGSRFSIILPWQPNEAVSEPPIEEKTIPEPKAALETQAKNGKILLVDDTDSVILFIQDYLESLGYEVIVAHDGLGGIEEAKKHHPDIILMDIQMPGISGLDATRQIRTKKGLRKIPIIALTAMAMPGDRERCLEAGMNEYISKPVHLKELSTMIEKFIHTKPTEGAA